MDIAGILIVRSGGYVPGVADIQAEVITPILPFPDGEKKKYPDGDYYRCNEKRCFRHRHLAD